MQTHTHTHRVEVKQPGFDSHSSDIQERTHTYKDILTWHTREQKYTAHTV